MPPDQRLLLVGDFSASRVGNQSVAEELARRLEQGGWRVSVTSAAAGPLGRALDTVATTFRLRRRVDLVVIDVYSGRAFWWAEAASRLAASSRPGQVLVLRGGGLADAARRHPGRLRRLLARADRVVAPSPFLAHELGSPERPVEVIPNPLELARYTFRQRQNLGPDLVWLRSLRSIYNPQMAVRTVARLRDEHPETRLTLYGLDHGDGTADAVEALVRRRSLRAVVDVAGSVPKHRVAQTLARHDIFLNTSSVDNAPVSVLEAMASGLPVVSTRVGGIPYLVEDGRTALLVDSDDDAAMADAVSRLLTEPGLAAELSRQARRWVERCDWRQVLPAWENLLSEALASRRTGDRRCRSESR